jgi:predicted DNA-binding transcriptional regulator YafY
VVSRSARLLSLLQALRGRRRPVTAAQLAGDLEVSERTVYRDVATLMAQGAPIQGEAGVGYMLRPGLFLPPLMLSQDETEAVLLGLRYVDQRGDEVLRTASSSALAKISSVLSPLAEAALNAPLAIPGPTPRPFPDDTIPISQFRAAIRGQRRLDIGYQDGEGRRSQRVIWPIQLGFMDRGRVVAGWCELRRDFRMFRTDRILTATELDRYPGRRSDLLRRLRAHLEEAGQHSPDEN